MTGPTWMILTGDEPWRLVVMTDRAVQIHPISTDADEIRTAMVELGYRGRGVALGVASEGLMIAVVDTDNLPRRNRRRAMVYRLEEHLPASAEEIVADFVENHTTAVAASARVGPLAKIVDALEAAGVIVQVVSPIGALALQSLAEHVGQEEVALLAVRLDGRVELARLQAGRPDAWHSLPDDAVALRRAVQIEMLRLPASAQPRLTVVGFDEPPTLTELEIGTLDVNPLEAAARSAQAALRGEDAPWFDFRRGPVGPADRLRTFRRPLAFCALTAAALMLAMTATFLLRARAYGGLAADLQVRERRVYQDLHPGRPAPPSVRGRLASDARRLRSLRTVTAETPGRPCALDALRDAIARLPADVNLRVLEVQIDPDRIVLEGQSRTHGDAEKLAAALRGGPFDMEPARTERLELKAVAFTLAGTRPMTGRRRSP